MNINNSNEDYLNRIKRFIFPQSRTGNSGVDQANSDVVKSSPSNDIYSGAKLGIQTAIDDSNQPQNQSDHPIYDQHIADMKSQDINGTNDSPVVNSTNEPEIIGRSNLNTGIADLERARQAIISSGNGNKDIDQMRNAAVDYSQAVKASASQDLNTATQNPMNSHVSKTRKGLSIAAGIAQGALGGGIGGGISTYERLAHRPALQEQQRQAQIGNAMRTALPNQEKAVEGFGKVATQANDAVQTGIQTANADIALAQATQSQADDPQRMALLKAQTAQANSQTNTVDPAQADLMKAQALKLRNPDKHYEQKTGSINGKPAFGYFETSSHKTYDADGNDISSSFIPKDSNTTADDQGWEAYQSTHPGSNFNNYQAWKAGLTPNITYGLSNPGGTPDKVKWIAQAAAKDFGNYKTLVGADKELKQQVDDELVKMGVNPVVLQAQTKQLAQSAHSIIPKMDGMLTKLDDPKFAAKLGPTIGRWNTFLSAKVGSVDPEFQDIKETVDLLNTGIMRAHVGARGGGQMLEHFKDAINTDHMDVATLKASLKAAKKFIQGYEAMEYNVDDDHPTSSPVSSPSSTPIDRASINAKIEAALKAAEGKK